MNVITLLTPKAQVACLNEEWTVRQGLEKLRVGGYTALPVLSREGMYVGTVSEGDFLWNMLDDQNNTLRSMEQRPLKTIMRPGFNPAVSVRVTMADLLDQARRATESNQPTRRGRPVTVPYSWAMSRILSPVSSCSSVGNGPAPTLVV